MICFNVHRQRVDVSNIRSRPCAWDDKMPTYLAAYLYWDVWIALLLKFTDSRSMTARAATYEVVLCSLQCLKGLPPFKLSSVYICCPGLGLPSMLFAQYTLR